MDPTPASWRSPQGRCLGRDQQSPGASAGGAAPWRKAGTSRAQKRGCPAATSQGPPQQAGSLMLCCPLLQFSRSEDAPTHQQGPNQVYNVSWPVPRSPWGEGPSTAGRGRRWPGLGLRSGLSPSTLGLHLSGLRVLLPGKTGTVISPASWGRWEAAALAGLASGKGLLGAALPGAPPPGRTAWSGGPLLQRRRDSLGDGLWSN